MIEIALINASTRLKSVLEPSLVLPLIHHFFRLNDTHQGNLIPRIDSIPFPQISTYKGSNHSCKNTYFYMNKRKPMFFNMAIDLYELSALPSSCKFV